MSQVEAKVNHNAAGLIMRAARTGGWLNQPAVICQGKTLDYAELEFRITRFAGLCRDRGLVAGDRARYRSQLVTLRVSPTGMAIEEIWSFTGVAEAAALDGERLLVADADLGIRVFALGSGLPRPLAELPLGAQP